MPAIVFDACGRMVIGGSGEVGECLSIDQSHFSYSVSVRTLAAAAAKGHPILAVQQTHSRAPPTAYASL